MLNFELDATDIEDLKVENNSTILGGFKEIANEVISKGGKVIIKRSYINAEDDHIKDFTSSKVFNDWWEKNII